ncbi:hypothetical protein EGW08_019790 [Elysia chlorotica]|uniref:Serine protease 12 n=1 Tax=Elysia chlorotica TaxID=188477 RepID=A0A433ST42_ELYCH|nr:hypothetical protein EGW08_019790 [Elysia chlorotica]
MKVISIFSVLLWMCILSSILSAAVEGKKNRRQQRSPRLHWRNVVDCATNQAGRKHLARGRSKPCPTEPPVYPSNHPSGQGRSVDSTDLQSRLDTPTPRHTLHLSPQRSKRVKVPSSGQKIRLESHAYYHNMGVVSVYRGGAWGYICDTDWDIRDADVACRQLGFKRALSAKDNSTRVDGGSFVMGNVRCSGTEASLQKCRYSPAHNCPFHQAATVRCEGDSGCPEGWIPGFGKCYRLFADIANIKLAAAFCAMQNANLVNVLSKEENHFLSNFVINSAPEISQWHTGAVKRKGQWTWYKRVEKAPKGSVKPSREFRRTSRFKTVSLPVTEEMWFPGWPSHWNIFSEPSNGKRKRCLTLSNHYKNQQGRKSYLDYFYWKADVCSKTSGINIICQIELNEKTYEEKDKAGYSVRLVGGTDHSGTVEMSYMGSTGLICDDEWDMADAAVICRMLGYRGAETFYVGNHFEYPTNKAEFLLDDVQCLGNETSIGDCEAAPFKTHNCRAFEIAGVKCQLSKVCESDQFKCPDETCVEARRVCDGTRHCDDGSDEDSCDSYPVKLVNGSTPWEGRVQVSIGGLPGSVCDDQWDHLDAGVVCRALGMNYGGVAIPADEFGPGSGPVWMDNVQCRGDEESLDKCPHKGWGLHDCDHSEDAAVRCFTSIQTTTTEQLSTMGPVLTTVNMGIPSTLMARETTSDPQTSSSSEVQLVDLVGSHSDHLGNIAVTISGISYRVCDHHWNDNGATVVCRMLGYRTGGLATYNSYFGTRNNEAILYAISCVGTENSLDECELTFGSGEQYCNSNRFAGAICTQSVVPTDPPDNTIEPIPVGLYGSCGQRPYDKLDLLARKRRSLITSNHLSSDKLSIQTLWNMKPRTESEREFRIAGGHYVPQGKYPWQVGIRLMKSVLANGTRTHAHHCGGTVISEYWILSAAHCFIFSKERRRRKTNIRVVVGDHDTSLLERGEQMFEVEELILHTNFSVTTNDYDIALLKVKRINERGIVFSDYVQPACLPTPATPYVENTMCETSGWGRTGFGKGDIYPTKMKAVSVPLIGHEKCKYLYVAGKESFFTQRMMCAGYMEGGKDACKGDSGGPLVCKMKGVYTLMGITSWGFGCAEPKAPGVYALVQEFLPWIHDNIIEHSFSTMEKTLPAPPGAS